MSCAIGHFCFNAYFNTKNKYVYYTLWRSAAWVSLDVWLCYLIYNNKPSTLCLSLRENSLHTSSISVYYIPNSKLVSILTLVQRSSCHPDDMRKWAYVTVYLYSVCNMCVCNMFCAVRVCHVSLNQELCEKNDKNIENVNNVEQQT